MATSKINTPLFKQVQYRYGYTVSANSTIVITAEQLEMNPPSGFNYAVIVNATTGNNDVLIRGVNADGGMGDQANGFILRNVTSSSKTANCTITVLYIKA